MADDRDEDLLRSLYLQGKVVLVGDSGVGKTAIFNSFSDGVGFGEFRKTWTTPNGDNLVLTLFDTPCGEITGTPGNTPPILLKGDKSVLLVYSIDDLESFLSIRYWLNEVTSKSRGSDPLIGMVGNKIDRESQRAVTLQMAKEFASKNLISEDLVFEVSAKNGTNLQSMFNDIAIKLKPSIVHPASSIKISTTSSKSGCCQ